MKIETLITKRINLGNRIDSTTNKEIRRELIKQHDDLCRQINALDGIDYSDYRYDPVLGFNTKQYFIYDNYRDAYIDPPKEVLDELDKVRNEAGWFDYDAAEGWLLDLCNCQSPDWLNDVDYTYYGDIDL